MAKKIWIPAALLFIFALAFLVWNHNKGEDKYSSALQKADEYMKDEKYDEAIIKYKEATKMKDEKKINDLIVLASDMKGLIETKDHESPTRTFQRIHIIENQDHYQFKREITKRINVITDDTNELNNQIEDNKDIIAMVESLIAKKNWKQANELIKEDTVRFTKGHPTIKEQKRHWRHLVSQTKASLHSSVKDKDQENKP
ncbi:hypothetical protein MZM54_02660 [[Brevibacterium] frigoritolerans]|nr:hypothetical protein [Peribacillus frigoritolerans]